MNILLTYQKLKLVSAFVTIALFISLTASGQAVIGVVDYMQVDDPNEYLELEKTWQKIHQERLREGMIEGWAVYEVMFKTVEDPYNYITVSWYDSFSKLDKGIPESVIEAALPNMSKEERKAFDERTNNSRKRIASGVFHQRLTCANNKLDSEGKYYIINEISVNRGQSKELLRLYEEIYKPLFQEDIKNNNRTNWSFWEKWPGNMKDFQYLSADGYANLEQIDHTNLMKYFKMIHPDKDAAKISDRIEELRTLVNSEMWKMIYRVVN